ncbi:MAG: DUF2281 domain-containing protein, partial [Desulfobacterales bacterium]|nr:DUF2281 domain-containing protein [Desulfobacterales bacterium]
NIMPLEKIYVKPNVKVIITFLEEDTETIKREKDKPERKSGTLKGKIHIQDDFDEPIDDFKEYME